MRSKGGTMTLQEAVGLVKQKQIREQTNQADLAIERKYDEAWAQFPATLRIAHVLLAMEMAKSS